MDPFQVRLRFVSALQRVNASLPTIQKALSFVVEHAATLHPELWECITDELKSASINRRINLLFLIDAIFTDDTLSATVRSVYTPHLERDLYLIFDLAVPEDRWNALLNLPAATKMISSWKSRFVLERGLLEDVEKMLEVRRAALYAMSPEKRRKTVVDAGDMQRRIEEDRERHKRLRERAWILPATAYTSQSLFGTRPEQLDPTYLTRTQTASPRAERDDVDGDRVWTTQDLDFSHMWEETSDFNDDDVEAIQEDLKLSWANQPPPPQPTPQPPIHPSRAQERFSASRPPREPASMRHVQRAP